MNENIDEKYTKYALDVVNEKIVACKYVKQACKRYLSWFDKYEFKPKKADKVVNFIHNLKHFTGKHNNKNFELLPYQEWFIYSIFGFYYPNTANRVIHYAYIELARKSGKTSIVAAILLYMLIADGENGSEVELLANSRPQAHIAFDICFNYAKGLDPKGKYIKALRDKIRFDVTKSFMQILSADAGANDGYNSYAFVLDEAHEQQTSKLWDVMVSSQGMRNNSLGIIITTAGFNLNGFCYSYRNTCLDILSGLKENDSQFVAIYTLDEGDDWTDEKNWIKANPTLDTTVSRKYLAEQVQNAKNNSALEVGVKTKNFNMWCQSMEVWIDNDTIIDNSTNVDFNEFTPETECFVGIDLASVSDMTAVNYLMLKDGKLINKTMYYLPESALIDNSNKLLYKQWYKDGFLKITAGNTTDYDIILKDILEIRQKVQIVKVAYDSWNSAQFAINATEQGLPMYPYSQSIGNFNRPTKEFQRLIKSTDKIILDNNPITRWCFQNVKIKEDFNCNQKPIKGAGDQNKIDGVIAILQSIGGYLETPRIDMSIV